MDVQTAEKEINKILSQLEQSTGSVIESLQLERLEITTVDSDRAKYITTVVIFTARLPGHDWSL